MYLQIQTRKEKVDGFSEHLVTAIWLGAVGLNGYKHASPRRGLPNQLRTSRRHGKDDSCWIMSSMVLRETTTTRERYIQLLNAILMKEVHEVDLYGILKDTLMGDILSPCFSSIARAVSISGTEALGCLGTLASGPVRGVACSGFISIFINITQGNLTICELETCLTDEINKIMFILKNI
ncbi:unnamed protein product [Leptidea sinapis]|uniref:Uncharacterized protein n=1 Tax=Leptidea sinapis TaxID=189913 RepID=A0A5E4QIR9_9NEOP|nr:unnamed protein product [Leptidea sinapis]